MNKQQLANRIWESANKMRSKIEANEYKDYILGFIFYKYLSDKEVKFLIENDYTDELLPTAVSYTHLDVYKRQREHIFLYHLIWPASVLANQNIYVSFQ